RARPGIRTPGTGARGSGTPASTPSSPWRPRSPAWPSSGRSAPGYLTSARLLPVALAVLMAAGHAGFSRRFRLGRGPQWAPLAYVAGVYLLWLALVSTHLAFFFILRCVFPG